MEMTKRLPLVLIFLVLTTALAFSQDFILEEDGDGNTVLLEYIGHSSHVVIPEGVTSIGEKAFAYCESLESITIPDSVASIGDGAFYYCSSLETITFGDSVVSFGDNIFQRCDSLEKINGIEHSPVFNHFLGTEYEQYLVYTPSWLAN